MVASSCVGAFLRALNASGQSWGLSLPFLAVLGRPPPPHGSPSALRARAAQQPVLRGGAVFDLTDAAQANAMAARAVARRRIDPALLGWEAPAPLFWSSPGVSTRAGKTVGSVRHSVTHAEASFIVEAPFAPREVSRGLFPRLFGEHVFATSMGLPKGRPLAVGTAASGAAAVGAVGAAGAPRPGPRRSLLLSGKEPWLSSPWAAVEEAAAPSTRAAQPAEPRATPTAQLSSKQLGLLNHLDMGPIDEWPPPRCCHPHRADRRNICVH